MTPQQHLEMASQILERIPENLTAGSMAHEYVGMATIAQAHIALARALREAKAPLNVQAKSWY